jgi:nucleoside-diphosphate-sugar epimerase
MKRLLIIGSGDVARRAAPSLIEKGFRLYALIRDPLQGAELRALGIKPVVGDLDDWRSLRRLKGLAQWVLHFAPPPKGGNTDPRTRRLLAVLGKSLPQRLVYISTSGVYGDCGGEEVSESRPTHPRTVRAIRREDAENRLRAWARRTSVRLSILRVAGIYARDRLPLDRLRRQLPVFQERDDSYVNHIHADDLARLAIAALFRGAHGRIYNAADDLPMKTSAWFDFLAERFGFSKPPRIPRSASHQHLPESLRSFSEESRRLVNRRAKKELRFAFRYPTPKDALT